MPPPLSIDLSSIDLTRALLNRKQIYGLLPHRHEFQVLDAIHFFDVETKRIVSSANLTMSDWWVKAHVEGRPLLPGALMLEMAGQSAAVLARLAGYEGFIGFGGVENCKFREAVVPPAKFVLLNVGVEYRSRRIVTDSQGVVDGRLVFEARITGLAIR